MERIARAARPRRFTLCSLLLALLALLSLLACQPEDPPTTPQVGSQTNWLRACDASADCDGLECVCGACTARCQGEMNAMVCDTLAQASCIPADDVGVVALCDGQAAPSDVCLPRCEAGCPSGTRCQAGVCAPTASLPPAVIAEPPVMTDDGMGVVVDTGTRYQTLIGFGASLAYAEDPIVTHPEREALYDLAFVDAGLDVLRVGNRYDPAQPGGALPAGEIMAAAAARIGRMPLLFMTSGSPPPSLKQNGLRMCAGELETCTLTTLPDGGFDYAGFASYWRQSLEAYAAAGVFPDYVSIQNNPNWIAPADKPNDACRFLPREGSTTVDFDGTPTDVRYPGYVEALAAVQAAIADLPTAPRFTAPEANGVTLGGEYIAALDVGDFDAVAIHLYDVDAMDVDVSAFSWVRDLAGQLDRPVFQTEMQAEGLETAILIHHALTAAGATAYLQNDLVAWMPEQASISLVALTPDGLEPQDPFYALSQYASYTDRDWVRVEATLESPTLLGSAWLSPAEDALTVVLVNPGTEDEDARLALPDDLRAAMQRTELMRTVFDGEERATRVGALAPDDIVTVPAGGVVTVAFSAQ